MVEPNQFKVSYHCLDLILRPFSHKLRFEIDTEMFAIKFHDCLKFMKISIRFAIIQLSDYNHL